jgi:ribosome-associated translation inhibitor RaiA
LREVYDAIGKVEDLEKELNKLERKVKDDSLNEKENKN